MNETIKVLMERRSVRSFASQQVDDSDLEQILVVGRHAPTAMNRQPWHFTVLQNAALAERITEAARAGMLASGNERLAAFANQPGLSVFHHAPTVLLVSGQEGPYAATDCANAAENMAIAAQALGLASCYVAAFQMALAGPDGEDLKQALGIPEGYQPLYGICLGYRQGDAPPAPARKENVVNYVR